jgi:arylformamidase
MTGWIDISVPLRSRMAHWPGDAPLYLDQVSDMARGDAANVSTISMSVHTGTHMDAPRHFVADGPGIDTMPLNATVGTARVIEIQDEDTITAEELERHTIVRGDRLLFKTRNSERCWKSRCFLKQFVHIRADAAQYLASHRVRCVGVDYLSVGGYQTDGVETHQILLGAGIWLIEGLDLSGVEPGRYELVCLPLKIEGGDGAPARAIVRKLVNTAR